MHGLERVARHEGTTPLADLRALLRTAIADMVHKPHVRNAIAVIELRCKISAETNRSTNCAVADTLAPACHRAARVHDARTATCNAYLTAPP